MDASEYYISLSQEMDAIAGRIRQLIADAHWLTDGEWKETVLRSVIRRHLPPSVGIGRGFIVGPRQPSSQIDILLYDTSYPLLHQDGDLVFVVPQAVRAIIEVKSTLRADNLGESLAKLVANAQLVEKGAKAIFLGLFAFENGLGRNARNKLFTALQQAALGDRKRAVNHICVGPATFVRFWGNDPYSNGVMNVWREYQMQNRARGYFAFNALELSVGDNVRKTLWAWFPRQGKEHVAEAPLTAAQ